MILTNKAIIIISLILLIIILVTFIFYYSEFFEEMGSNILQNERAVNESIDGLATVFNRTFKISETFINDLLKSSLSLFVVINPVGSIALLISMTARMDTSERKVVSKNIMITAAGLLIAFGGSRYSVTISIWYRTLQLYDSRRNTSFYHIDRIAYSWNVEIWRFYIY